MILQLDLVLLMILVRGAATEDGCTMDLHIVLDQDSVQQDRHSCRRLKHLLIVEDRSLEKYLVRLPLTWSFCRVCKRNILFVDTASHSIGVGEVVPVVQDLQLVSVLEEDAAVATPLAVTL